jgi:hypothetical protein
MDASGKTSPRKQDRSTVPCLILLVACVMFAYGLSADSVLLQWTIPVCLVGTALAYGLWPKLARLGRRSS